jgi:hypothetical protein
MQTRLTVMSNIKRNLRLAQERMKKNADKNRSERELNIGDMAYLKLQPYMHSSLGLQKQVKLHSKFYGLFKVPQKIGNVAYKLMLPEGYSIHHVFHVSQIKKHIGPKVIPQANFPLTDSEGNIMVYHEKLLNRRMIPRNNESVIQWMIQWVNLPPTTTTWEDSIS